MSTAKYLGELTGSWHSSSSCGGALWNTQGCIDRLTLSYVTNLGMPTLPRDGWGDPILIEENEGEPSSPCSHDMIWSHHSEVPAREIPLSSLSNCP